MVTPPGTAQGGFPPLSEAPPLILASGSAARRAMLTAAGVPVADVCASQVNEAVIRAEMRHATVSQTADRLAEAKAKEVARRFPGCLVLGADQMLETAEGDRLDKPEDLAAARRQLQGLRGTTHRLVSAAVLVREGRTVWRTVDAAVLTMRAFDDPFLDLYLQSVGMAVTTSVGAYQLEGLGAHLFSAVVGDHFTILGLPLLPLLEALRKQGVCPG